MNLNGVVQVVNTSSFTAGCTSNELSEYFDKNRLKNDIILGIETALKKMWCQGPIPRPGYSGKY